MVAAACLVAGASGGCQSARPLPGEADSARWLGQAGDRPAAPSLVSQPPTVRHELARLRATLGPAWWETRRDTTLSVEAGYASPVISHSQVVTYDRQSTHDGHVHDHYHRRRTSVEHSMIVR